MGFIHRLRSPLQKLAMIALIGGVSFHVATYIMSMFLGFSLFFFTSEGSNVATQLIRDIPVYVFLNVSVIIPAPLTTGVLFLVLWVVFWVCVIVGWKGPEVSLHKVFRKCFSNSPSRLLRNYLVFFPLISSMVLLVEFLLESLQEAQGIPTGSLSIPNPYELFFTASYAAVSEEVGFRMIPIGAVAALYVLCAGFGVISKMPTMSRVKLVVLTFLYPEGAKRKIGLKHVGNAGWSRGISKFEWLIVLASACIFALAHVISGAGWGPGKFTLTFMVGFVFGLVYIVYGITAAVLMHWFHNYYLVVYWISYDLYGASFKLFVDSVDFAILTFGITGWVTLAAYLSFKGVHGLMKHKHTVTRIHPTEILPI